MEDPRTTFRTLKDGERIESPDFMPTDNGKGWEPVPIWMTGMQAHDGLLPPIRRRCNPDEADQA